MAENKVHTRYKNLKKAEIWLENYIAKYLEKANPKNKDDIAFYMKKAEENLFGRQGNKNIPKEVLQVIKQSQSTGNNFQRAGASFFTSLAVSPYVFLHNLDAQSRRDANKRALKAGVTPRYTNIPKNKSYRIPVQGQSPLTAGGNNIVQLLEAVRADRYTTEDILGTRMASDVDVDALSGLKLFQGTWDTAGTNIFHMDSFDNITYADRKSKERQLFSRLQKGNTSYENVFYKSGSNWRTQLDKSSPNYHLNTTKSSSTAPLSISKQNEYFGSQPFDKEQGNVPWSNRSVRGPTQANAETRALLISKGADERQVNKLSDSVLSRYRISGGFESDTNIQLLSDRGSINLKIGNKGFNTDGGRVYEGTSASKLNIPIKKVVPKVDPYKGKPLGSRLQFSDPLD